jgi:hypothetical protein
MNDEGDTEICHMKRFYTKTHKILMLPQALRYVVFAPFLPVMEKDALYPYEEEQALQALYQLTHQGIKTFGVAFLGEHTERLVFRDQKIAVNIGERTVHCQVWEHLIYTANGNMNSVYFIDTDLSENAPEDRPLSRQLFSNLDEYTMQAGLFAQAATQTALVHGTKNLDVALTFGNTTALVELALHAIKDYRRVKTYTFLLDEWNAHANMLSLDTLRTSFPEMKLPSDFMDEAQVSCRDMRLVTAERAYVGSDRLAEDVQSIGKAQKFSFTPFLYPEFWLPDTTQHWLSSQLENWHESREDGAEVFDISLASIAHLVLSYKKSLREYVKSTQGLILEEDMVTLGMSVHTLDEVYSTLLQEPSRLLKLAENMGALHLVVMYRPTIVTHQEVQREKDFQLFAERYYHTGIRFTLVKDPTHRLVEDIMPGIDLWLTSPSIPAQSNGQLELAALLYGIPFITGKNHPVLSREYQSFGWYLSEFSSHTIYDLLGKKALAEVDSEKYVTRRRAGLALSLHMFQEEGEALVRNILLSDG